jgi:hypothetical protein
MTVDSSRPTYVNALLEGARSLRRSLKNIGSERSGTPVCRRPLTPEQFQEELAVLGLSGKRYTPEEYAQALGRYLGISIVIHVIPDACYPELSRRLALSGRLGELRYAEQLGLAAIFVPGSLPPLVLSLTVLHELGHLAAGDLLIPSEEHHAETAVEQGAGGGMFVTSRIRNGKKLAGALPFADEEAREHEANLRASYALLSGCLGGDSPYAYRMNDIL